MFKVLLELIDSFFLSNEEWPSFSNLRLGMLSNNLFLILVSVCQEIEVPDHGTFPLSGLYNGRPRWGWHKTIKMVNGTDGRYWCLSNHRDCQIYSGVEPDGGWKSPLEVPNSNWCYTYSWHDKCVRPKSTVFKCVQGKYLRTFLDLSL